MESIKLVVERQILSLILKVATITKTFSIPVSEKWEGAGTCQLAHGYISHRSSKNCKKKKIENVAVPFLKAGFDRTKYPEAVQQKQLQSQSQVEITEGFSAAQKLPKSSKRAKEPTDAIDYFAKDLQPVSVVQGVGFQHVMNYLEP